MGCGWDQFAVSCWPVVLCIMHEGMSSATLAPFDVGSFRPAWHVL